VRLYINQSFGLGLRSISSETGTNGCGFCWALMRAAAASTATTAVNRTRFTL